MEDDFAEIESSALTAMIESSKLVLSEHRPLDDIDRLESASLKIAEIPLSLVIFICKKNSSTLHYHVIPTEEQFQKGATYIRGIIAPPEPSTLGSTLTIASYALNPLGRYIRSAITSNLDIPPEIKRLTPVLRGPGLDLVLGVLDELINQNIPTKKIISDIADYHKETTGQNADSFEEARRTNVDLGIVSGACDEKSAKIGGMIGGVGGVLAGAKAGAIIGSVVPGPGTVIGAAIGAGLGRIIGDSFGNGFGQGITDQPKEKSASPNRASDRSETLHPLTHETKERQGVSNPATGDGSPKKTWPFSISKKDEEKEQRLSEPPTPESPSAIKPTAPLAAAVVSRQTPENKTTWKFPKPLNEKSAYPKPYTGQSTQPSSQQKTEPSSVEIKKWKFPKNMNESDGK